ncbi:MAG: phenylalanine--tRNA ligase subunit alpha, partial [Fidelibacterota bacterium]
MTILNSIDELKKQFDADVKSGNLDKDSLEEIKRKYTSRKGAIAKLFSELGNADSETRPKAGKALNELKEYFSNKINDLSAVIEDNSEITADDHTDFTLPGDPFLIGSIHPLTHVINEITAIFTRLGFSLAYGPEIDTDFYNFEALNIQKHHPARDMQDTFYVTEDVVLRTHTSNNQIH